MAANMSAAYANYPIGPTSYSLPLRAIRGNSLGPRIARRSLGWKYPFEQIGDEIVLDGEIRELHSECLGSVPVDYPVGESPIFQDDYIDSYNIAYYLRQPLHRCLLDNYFLIDANNILIGGIDGFMHYPYIFMGASAARCRTAPMPYQQEIAWTDYLVSRHMWGLGGVPPGPRYIGYSHRDPTMNQLHYTIDGLLPLVPTAVAESEIEVYPGETIPIGRVYLTSDYVLDGTYFQAGDNSVGLSVLNGNLCGVGYSLSFCETSLQGGPWEWPDLCRFRDRTWYVPAMTTVGAFVQPPGDGLSQILLWFD